MPNSEDSSNPINLITPSRKEAIKERLKRDMDTAYYEAKRSMVTTTARIPPWILVLLCFLGWNEFVAVLSNPLYLFFIIFAGAGAYFLYVTNMIGPALHLGKAMLREGMPLFSVLRQWVSDSDN